MGKGSAPPPPDYTGAAQAQGAANVDTARTQGRLNNPSFTSPYGSRQVTFNPDDTVNMNDTLTPAGQQQFDQQQRISSQLGNVAESGIGRVAEGFATPFDTTNLPPLLGAPTADQATRDQVQKALIDRQQPLWDRQRAATETRLANQGITQGSEAWKNAEDDLARQENDAKLATIAAGGDEMARQFGLQLQGNQFGNQERQQAIQEESFLRSLPLNEINALRSGNQVGVPTFQGYTGGGNIQAPNLLGATQAGYDSALGGYNADQAKTQGYINTAGTLGAAAMLATSMF